MKLIQVIIFLLTTFAGFGAEPAKRCAVCQQPLGAKYFLIASPARPEKRAVCTACTQLQELCFVCQLPVKINFQKLDDGRLLCAEDKQAAIFNPVEAQRVFEEARRDLATLFPAPLPHPITIKLVDATELGRRSQEAKIELAGDATLGLTHTHITSQGKQTNFSHTIYLLNGLGRARLSSVCAHEFAHAWINEHVPQNRKFDPDVVEGFCELVAYKLMTLRNDPVQKEVILSNSYTKGEIQRFVEADRKHPFPRVLDWMKTGANGVLPPKGDGSVTAAPDAPEPATAWPRQVKTTVPDMLVLKGIAGTTRQRFALINDTTFIKNEEAKVRVGQTNVTVRCLDILEKSVVIQVNGAAQRMELLLHNK